MLSGKERSDGEGGELGVNRGLAFGVRFRIDEVLTRFLCDP